MNGRTSRAFAKLARATRAHHQQVSSVLSTSPQHALSSSRLATFFDQSLAAAPATPEDTVRQLVESLMPHAVTAFPERRPHASSMFLASEAVKASRVKEHPKLAEPSTLSQKNSASLLREKRRAQPTAQAEERIARGSLRRNQQVYAASPVLVVDRKDRGETSFLTTHRVATGGNASAVIEEPLTPWLLQPSHRVQPADVASIPLSTILSGTEKECHVIHAAADAVVYIGGFYSNDLSTTVLPAFLKRIPLPSSVARAYDADAQYDMMQLDNNKVQEYLKLTVMRRTMKEKQCFLRQPEGIDFCYPFACKATGGMDGPEVCTGETKQELQRRRVFLSFGSCDWYPSTLNHCEQDRVRAEYRPAFGFSEWRLLERLPRVMVEAARLLYQRCQETMRRERHCPSLAFWLSCVGHICSAESVAGLHDDIGAHSVVCDISEFGDPNDIVRYAVKAISSEHVFPEQLSRNFFLPVESFRALPWWSTLEARRRALEMP